MTAKRASLWNIFMALFLISTGPGMLLGCQESHPWSSSVTAQKANSSIIGGDPVGANSLFGQKILYLAGGVSFQLSKDGASQIRWTSHCTAAAISPRIVLTAGHCLFGKSKNQIAIILKANPESSDLNEDDVWMASDIQIHPQFFATDTDVEGDLGLVFLSKDLDSSHILKMAQADQIQLPMKLVSIGYGTTSDSSNPAAQGEQPYDLHYVMKDLTTWDVDQRIFTIDQSDHKGFCKGDSGGPGLIYDSVQNEFFIVGVVSTVSMFPAEKQAIDPENKFSMCIGRGNYTNVINPGLRGWIQSYIAN